MNLQNMNVLIFVTDQERKVMNFPPGWAEQNLPGLSRLKANGLSLDRAFTNACSARPLGLLF
jgi:arylsulfatase A-like enzyme